MRFVVVALVACSSSSSTPAPQPEPVKPVRGTITADSTIAKRDYIGPAACAGCHADQHARWEQSLHRTMNQRAEGGAILGKAATVDYAGGTMTFDPAAATMTLVKGERRVHYKVTRTIGTRGLQEYVGIVIDASPSARPSLRGNAVSGKTEEVRLPFAWWPRRAGWYPQPYFDPWLEEAAFDPYVEVTDPWATRCPWCHSTYPFTQRIARSVKGVGHGLEQFFEVADPPPTGAVTPAPTGAATPALDRLKIDDQVTVGISCESCHLGGRAHADGAPIHFVPIGATARDGAPKLTTFAAERSDPLIVNRVCAQCHSGPSPRFPDGSASRNSSEALDLATSQCVARCVDCHDPHRADSRLDEARSIAACTRCHADRATPDHAGAGHDKTSCLDCHMPKIVMGIDRHVRTHRIGSPTDRRMLAAAAPNACNVCHLDRTIEWTVAELRERYGVKRDPRPWSYVDSVGETWLASREPAVRLIAAAAYARSPLRKSALPELLGLLDDPLAYVRVWAVFALEDALGRRVTEYDPMAPIEERRRQLAALRQSI